MANFIEKQIFQIKAFRTYAEFKRLWGRVDGSKADSLASSNMHKNVPHSWCMEYSS